MNAIARVFFGDKLDPRLQAESEGTEETGSVSPLIIFLFLSFANRRYMLERLRCNISADFKLGMPVA